MSRIIGLDIGERRIGIAISDETQTIARGLETIIVAGISDTINRIKDIVNQHKVKEVVVGLPLNMNGSKGSAAKKAIDFADKLKKNLAVAVSVFDERLTTKQGESALLQADISREKRKSKIDKIASQIMLQTYLDLKKERKN